MTGIYKIINVINGKVYVGSAIDIDRRLSEHGRALRSGQHHNDHLQKAYNKYGLEHFEFVPFFKCKKKDLLLYEQQIMDHCHSYEEEFGYNLCPIAGSCLGSKWPEESKTKFSESRKGKGNPNYGKKFSEESKQKMRDAWKRRKELLNIVTNI